MRLYLLRHAEAEILAASDAARRLTSKGEEQAARVGKFCAKHEITPAVILSSPVVRARQTADLVASKLPDAELVEVPWAACGMDPWKAMDELGAYAKFPAVQSLHVRKALLLGLDVSQGLSTGAGVLQFFLPVKLM